MQNYFLQTKICIHINKKFKFFCAENEEYFGRNISGGAIRVDSVNGMARNCLETDLKCI